MVVSQFAGNVDPEVDAAGEEARATNDAWRELRHYRTYRGAMTAGGRATRGARKSADAAKPALRDSNERAGIRLV
jgi:hypothetical protein